MINSSIWATIVVVTVSLKQGFSYTETCIGEFCFTTPGSNELENFNVSRSSCTNISSNLAVVNDTETQLALTQLFSTSKISSLLFINMRLYIQQANSWFLVNGIAYTGNVGNQGLSEYKLYCYLNPVGIYFQVDASQPNELKRYICEFEGIRCLKNSTNSSLFNGKCYVKYEGETLNWYKARERCIQSDGDLATFQSNSNDRWTPQLNTSWLNSSCAYWVGIRWSNLRWTSPDGGDEASYTSWASGKPNNINLQCVCVDPKGNPVGSWTDCDCNEIRPFACLKLVPTTTGPTTTTAKTTTSLTSRTMSEADSNLNSETNALAIGLGVGILGGAFLTLLIVTVVGVILTRKRRKSRSDGTANQFDRSTTGAEPRGTTATSAYETHYEPLEIDHKPGTEMPLYEQLNQPEFDAYEPIS